MRKSISLYIVCIMMMIFSCKKKENEVKSDGKSPVIDLLSVTPVDIVEFEDSIIIMIEYKDTDGDLGSEDPDENFLEIKDTRLEKPDYYFVPTLSPPNANVHIKGKLRVVVKNIFLLGNGDTETTSFEIRMRDRAGNWSNTVTSQTLTIRR